MATTKGIERVREWREEEGCTAAELGELIDRSGSLILKMETGIEPVTIGVGLALEKVTGIPLNSLLSRKLRSDVRLAAESLSASL